MGSLARETQESPARPSGLAAQQNAAVTSFFSIPNAVAEIFNYVADKRLVGLYPTADFEVAHSSKSLQDLGPLLEGKRFGDAIN